jgi:hyperosmotically inducible periplasmic protein
MRLRNFSWLPATTALLLAAGCAGGTSSASGSETASADAAVRGAIEEELRRDPIVERIPVQVRVDEGRVVLYGSVDTPAESERAEQIAREAEGARSVENKLRVGAGSDPTDRHVPIDALRGPGAVP